MIKISKPSKMKITGKKVGCWSLGARISCPGSVNPDGSIVDVCKSCYATKGMYRFPVVKNARKINKADYMEEDWVERMVAEVSKYDYFRWFDSGDIETTVLAAKIAAVIVDTPTTNHWLPTRSDKIPEIARAGLFRFKKSVGFSNVALRPSADHIGLNNKEREGVNSFVIKPEEIFEAKRRGIHVCPVGVNPTQKSCDTCTMCYTDAEVAYVLH
jgi:hypothetical protein